MEYQNAEDLIRKLSLSSKVESAKNLTEFYAKVRFKLIPEVFERQYTDGSNDGGIDFYHREDTTFFIFQTKFSYSPRKVNVSEIMDETRKIKNTLTGENPNKRAVDFVNLIRKEKGNRGAILEIVWLTTNVVDQSIRDKVQKDLAAWKRENGWSLDIDFVAVDKHALEGVVYDVKYGYIPHTGKKSLKLEEGQWIETNWEETGIYSMVCIVNVNDMLKWFRDSDEIDGYLQKNVREFLGEGGKINKTIANSYLDDPYWFWYKHNGIIILSDNLSIDKVKKELVLRNPQVVNGGQTLKALFSAYNKNQRSDNSAQVMVRIYRLPYEDTETYKRSIEIISALNSQNKINPSDLRSTDPRQVRLEKLLERTGSGYKYLRKRSKEAKKMKSGRHVIPMRNLALRYYVCKRNAPNEGVRGNLEELFEDATKYNDVFDENSINRDPGTNHVVNNYVTIWNIDQVLQKLELPKRDAEYFQYTKWYVLWDIYKKLTKWKQKKFKKSWQTWLDFVDPQKSYAFEKAVTDYSRILFKVGRQIVPLHEEARSFFRTLEAVKKFSSRASSRKFETLMNNAYFRFIKKNE